MIHFVQILVFRQRNATNWKDTVKTFYKTISYKIHKTSPPTPATVKQIE